ncbi:FAD/NAD(P)-binding protein [Pedobacter cryoconitis]|uniref:Putative NAD(P)/FAD-binding protein YdhS n=1 Tax=Pedobacter cryoconitis TaxID=188932 RepID=A0A7X0MHG7_9SPHI|nr:FAD/NAD(P)-binding protein [Pedobacter cryoconitis]MBB6498826.1 putative NAD(P)/FAD-binding protein YdhS [Pedobacter cryoconitis]
MAGKSKKRIAILGAGPSGLFLFKRFVEQDNKDFEIEIFERKSQIGSGMPYSHQGANDEHITNVSDNEIPMIVTSIEEWVQTAPGDLLQRYQINPDQFNEYKVLPRLFFGEYLTAQFDLLLKKARKKGLHTILHLNTTVTDITDQPEHNQVWVEINRDETLKFDHVIMSTGHSWPLQYEGKVPGYYDTPYPPAKLRLGLNHPVAIRGSSLTAIDAIRTIARHNGSLTRTEDGTMTYTRAAGSPEFRIILHSRNGMLPGVRFHLEDSHLSNDSLLTEEELAAHIAQNNGFLSLDYIFEKNFKDIFQEKDPQFYERIKALSVEEFVDEMMELRERLDPFQLLKAEYIEAEKSIKRQESVYWKEMLGVLSFALNYPAKYLSAEDMSRLHDSLIPLISIVIAYLPQSSCEELLALNEAGVLEMVTVGSQSEVRAESRGGATYYYKDENGKDQAVYYQTFIDCVGQPHLSYQDFPFAGMLSKNTITPARLKFSSAEYGKRVMDREEKKVIQGTDGTYYLEVPGIAINDNFQVLDHYGAYNDRIYMMAVPYIGGYNPDYSGLDFCEEASLRIVNSIKPFDL